MKKNPRPKAFLLYIQMPKKKIIRHRKTAILYNMVSSQDILDSSIYSV